MTGGTPLASRPSSLERITLEKGEAMLVLRAPAERGRHGEDFVWTEEDELLTAGLPCDTGLIYRSCGCERSFSGVHTRCGTTYGVVSSEPAGRVRRELETTRTDNGIFEFDDDWRSLIAFHAMLTEFGASHGDKIRVTFERREEELEVIFHTYRKEPDNGHPADD